MADEPQTVPAQARAVTMLEAEKVNPATTEIDRMSALEIAQVMNKVVQSVTGLERETAQTLLQQNGGKVKTALLIGKTNLTPGQTREQLAAHGDILRATLDELL